MTRRTVTVDAEDLERLVRLAHEVDTSGVLCHCGWRGYRRRPLTHVDHLQGMIAEALAGRIAL